jgi:hypothetical protein
VKLYTAVRLPESDSVMILRMATMDFIDWPVVCEGPDAYFQFILVSLLILFVKITSTSVFN